jgi:hypothetical protein
MTYLLLLQALSSAVLGTTIHRHCVKPNAAAALECSDLELPSCFIPGELAALGLYPVDRSDVSIRIKGTLQDPKNDIARIVLTEVLGYQVTTEKELFWNTEALTQCENGQAPDVDFEFWGIDYSVEQLERAFAKNCRDYGPSGIFVQNGWYISNSMLVDYPEAEFDFWRSYGKPEVVRLLPTITGAAAQADTNPDIAYFIPPQCQGTVECGLAYGFNVYWDPGYLQAQIRNLNLLLIILFANDDTRFRAYIQPRIDSRQPVLFEWWLPSSDPYARNFYRVVFPSPTSSCFADWQTALDGSGSINCDFLPYIPPKIGSIAPPFPPRPSRLGDNVMLTTQDKDPALLFIRQFKIEMSHYLPITEVLASRQ